MQGIEKKLIEKLYHRYRCEISHSLYVTGIALLLFDTLHKQLALPVSNRKILEYAALLHDIGFASNPDDHAEESAKIVLKESTLNLTEIQRRDCAAVILFHRSDISLQMQHPLYTSSRNKKRLLSCAAFLRIADGLDHGHIQDATIDKITVSKKKIEIEVGNSIYGGNIPFACKKSDLWERVFPKKIAFEEKKIIGGIPPFSFIFKPHDSIYEAARRLLYFHYRVIIDNYLNALQGDDPEYLHDIRVYFRRFRTLLRLFKSYLPKGSPQKISALIVPFLKNLGPIRDGDVWYEFFTGLMKQTKHSKNQQWQSYKKWLNSKRDKDNNGLQALLNSNECIQLIQEMRRFLRIDIPEYIRSAPTTVSTDEWAQKQVKKHLLRAINQARHTPVKAIEEMHALRKRIRNSRYITEELLAILPKHHYPCAKDLKRCAAILGEIHDIDVFLNRASSSEKQKQIPSDLEITLHQLRRQKEAAYQKRWDQFLSSRYLEKVIKNAKKKKERPMILYIFRHGIAEVRSEALADKDRALITRGKDKVQKITQKLVKLSFEPDSILTSPYRRALETANIITETLPRKTAVKIINALKPDGSFNELIKEINKNAEQSCCIVGHEPHLSTFASYLLSGTEDVSILLKKAGVCCLSFSTKVQKGCGHLAWLYQPTMLKL